MSCFSTLDRNRILISVFCVFILIDSSTELKDVRVTVPQAVLRGDTAVLLCLFNLEGDSLYSVKWYKGRREFYRFTPRENPAIKIFPILFLQVEESRSNATQVTLKHVHLSMSGKYSCEVSADAPSFHTALVTGDMEVVEVPKDQPVITGVRLRYKLGETLQGNCSSSWSKPAARLSWFINGEPAGPTMIRPHPASREPVGERHKSTLGLHLLVSPELFSAGRLKIRCTASLHHLYSQSTEKSVEEDRPRAGPSYIYTAPPPPPEDRFTDYEDENQGEDISAAASSGGGRKSGKWTGNGAGTISILVLLFSLYSVT